MRGQWARLVGEVAGQMAVELAVLLPVVLVVALTVVNLMRFVCACATFDRVAMDAVVSQGVSPAGSQSAAPPSGAIESCIARALDEETCSVSVRAEAVARFGGDGTTFSMSPGLTRYVCTLEYRPWPSSLVIAGMAYEPPVILDHERSLVVDRYRSGVVV